MLAARTLPENPPARATLIAERLRAVTGRQHVIVTCWCCEKDYAEGSDRYRLDADLFPVCVDENACNWRAVQAGLVPVLEDGGAA